MRIRVIGGPWPERIGCEGRTVEDELDPSVYPLKGRGGNEVVVLLDDDPLVTPEPRGEFCRSAEEELRWTCVIGRRDVLVISDTG